MMHRVILTLVLVASISACGNDSKEADKAPVAAAESSAGDSEKQIRIWKDLAISKQMLMNEAASALKLNDDFTADELREELESLSGLKQQAATLLAAYRELRTWADEAEARDQDADSAPIVDPKLLSDIKTTTAASE